MGINSDGVLFYGFLVDDYEEYTDVLDEEEEDDINDMGYWEDRYFFKITGRRFDWDKDRDQKDALIEAEDCFIGMHCSYDYPMYFVGIEKSHLTASRGYPKEITSWEIYPEWDSKIKKFCELMCIEYRTPKWYLTSLYG